MSKPHAVPSEQNNPLPMFFRAPQPIDATRHAKAGLVAVKDLSFAKGTNSISINAVEFFEAAKYYPIVFTLGEVPLPGVIVGMEQQNYFIDRKGHWKADTYIPAYVRKYPFLFLDVPEQKQLVLCVDEGAPQYREKGGKDIPALFEGAAPSELCRNALEFCKSYHQHYLNTCAFGEDMKRTGLLEPMQSSMKLSNGRSISLSGFYTIDEKRVAELPEATIIDFHKRGILPLIYAAMMSASNWKRIADLAHDMEHAA